jgi:hypothetical protein
MHKDVNEWVILIYETKRDSTIPNFTGYGAQYNIEYRSWTVGLLHFIA